MDIKKMQTFNLSSHLFAGLIEDADMTFTGISFNSDQVAPGHLFFAIPGTHDSGVNYLNEAVERGAKMLVVPRCNFSEVSDKFMIPCLGVDDVRLTLADVAGKFYGNPSYNLEVVGVTGTNGKSSVCHIISSAFNNLNKSYASIGTCGAGIAGVLSKTGNTTPDPVFLQEKIQEFCAAGVEGVCLEVSSHALDQKRVGGIVFDTVVFTNLSRDHLDYHGSLEDYYKSKAEILNQRGVHTVVINCDDIYGQDLARKAAGNFNVIGYSLNPKLEFEGIGDIHMLYADSVVGTVRGLTIKVNSPWGSVIISCQMIGEFNVSNIMAAIAVMGSQGHDLGQISQALINVKPLVGRMSSFGGDKNSPLVVVDYAHTPDALENALKALKAHSYGRLICVFGCGGDRDQGKRPIMGQVAERHSDYIFLTDDNPRNEDPTAIIRDIEMGLLCPWAADIEHDRSLAITRAIEMAKPGDVVLVAGKGHEDYQSIANGEIIEFSDLAEVQNGLSRKNDLETTIESA